MCSKMMFAATAVAVALNLNFSFVAPAFSGDGNSGPHVTYGKQGKIGEIIGNPYRIAPLTAIIKNGGYVLKDAKVRIVPKKGGTDLKYTVNDVELRTHAGIPVFGLYPDYYNTIEVEYTRILGQKSERIKETYHLYAPPVYTEINGMTGQKGTMFKTEVVKMDPKFKDRLYFVNNFLPKTPKSSRAVWNNPIGGALEWSYYPQNAIIDASGDVRWYMLPDPIYDMETIYHGGIMMGFKQGEDGLLTWGYGQRYVKYDILGREVWNRRLPIGYADFSHAMDPAQNGHYFLRVSSSDLKRGDGKNVHTVRDVILEVDNNGRAVDEFRLFDILDPYRDIVIKAMDQGAVCLNIDFDKMGTTMSQAELDAMDKDEKFGDIPGVGAGRNWAHVNSVDYDPTDDSIIISSRHQSALIKIGRDKKVKWILGSHEGWKDAFKDKLLTPVDKNGKTIKCDGSKCEGGFDWTWTQHTGWRIDSKSDKNIIYLTVFDNGDARGMEQPAFASEKYSRGVIYKIDQKKKTVQQIWEYGKERGHEWYSAVTSLTEYQPDKNSIMIYSATAGLSRKANSSGPNPFIEEFKWGEITPAVEIRLYNTTGYQAFPFSIEKALGKR